ASVATSGTQGYVLHSSSKKHTWVIDTGATDHMTFDPGQIISHTPPSQSVVSNANGTPSPTGYCICFVSVVSLMHSPSVSHRNAVDRILRYSKLAPGKGLMFSKNRDLEVVGYTDADWAGSITDRRSTSGYFTFVGGNLVTWRSKKQNVVSRSSAEANEERLMAHGVCELLWIRRLLTELGFKPGKPMELHCDNKSAIDIAHNPVQHD
ncbi:unnamed protein product, partial [Prunus brigantina]